MMLRTRRQVGKVLGRFQKPTETQDAILGRADGVVDVPGMPYGVYVRESTNSIPFVVYNFRVQPEVGLKVKIGKDPLMPGLTQVLSIRWVEGQISDGDPLTVPAHATTHAIDGADPIYITDFQMLPLLCYASGGMNVHFNGGWLTYRGRALYSSPATFSMSSSIPISGARYSIIRVNQYGVRSIQDGDVVPTYAELTQDTVPACESEFVPLALVRLYAGQTALNASIVNPDVRPLVWGGNLFTPSERAFSEKIFTIEGDVVSVTGTLRVSNHSGVTRTIYAVHLDISTPPQGSSLVADINMDGSSIFGSVGDQPTILANEFHGYSTAVATSLWYDGSILTLDIDQVGSTTPGANLTVTITYQG